MSSIYAGVLLFIVILFGKSLATTKSLNFYDICKNVGGHRIYLEIDEQGTIGARNLTTDYFSNETAKQECHLEIVTCPACIIYLNFSFLGLTHNCKPNKGSVSDCSCEYVQISEHPYEEISTKRFCGDNRNKLFSYKTQTRNVIIQLIYAYKNDHAFTAEFRSLRNRQFLSEEPEFSVEGTKSHLMSPFFPSYYLNDLSTEYVITCPKRFPEKYCRIRLLFSDFQIATMSIMEFFDWNGQRLDVVTGMHFRPPILISNGPSLVVRFYANGGTGLGFKAQYSFLIDRHVENRTEYNTDCGGFVDNLGGGITMMNMVAEGVKKYHCFWIIKPPKNYLHFKTHLYLKIVNFTDMEKKTEVIVHQGSTSAGKILEILRYPSREIYFVNPREHVQPIDTGFYVSLKGVFGVKSRLAIVYAAFSYKECFSGADFLCENHRCISRLLTCDGFDHCGDGSDEPATCFRDANPEPMDRRWYSHTPNYLFPKIDPYSDLKTATLVFIMSSFGLISLVSALFILLYRINTRVRHDQALHNHLQIITDILEEEMLDTESIQDEPPGYEAPPDYDDVVKMEYESDASGIFKPRRPKRKTRKGRIVKSQRPSNRETGESSESTQVVIRPVAESSIAIENQGPSSPPPYCETPVSQQAPLISSTTIDEVKSKNHFRKNNPLLYFSDKAISSNIKMLKRKWHSHGEVGTSAKREIELVATSHKHTKSKMCIFSSVRVFDKTSNFILYTRETASDSELMNIDQPDEENDRNNVETNHEASSEHQQNENYQCQCEGACGCAFDNSQNVRKKKGPKRGQTKFYTY